MRLNISPEPAILGFLLERPIHGYDLYKQVNDRLGVAWRIGLSQLYAILKTYETRGWIRSTVRSQGSRPSQKVVELTPAGRRAFAQWLRQPAHGLRELRVDFFLRLYFARSAGFRSTERLVDTQIAACQRELEMLKAQQAAAAKKRDDLGQLALSFRTHQLIAIIRWLNRHRGELRRPSPRTLVPSQKHIIHRSGLRRTVERTSLKEKKR